MMMMMMMMMTMLIEKVFFFPTLPLILCNWWPQRCHCHPLSTQTQCVIITILVTKLMMMVMVMMMMVMLIMMVIVIMMITSIFFGGSNDFLINLAIFFVEGQGGGVVGDFTFIQWQSLKSGYAAWRRTKGAGKVLIV